jgi:serine/threonine protein kinase
MIETVPMIVDKVEPSKWNSPEQAQAIKSGKPETASVAADIWSLGITLLGMIPTASPDAGIVIVDDRLFRMVRSPALWLTVWSPAYRQNSCTSKLSINYGKVFFKIC